MKKDAKKNKKEKKINEKKINKLFLIGGIILFVLLAGVIFVLYFFNRDNNIDNITVNELNYVEPLSKENEVEAAKLIKENIVKITNKIDEDTSVVGTGFFIKEGYLITNSHIVDIMGEITIEYSDGESSLAYLYSNSIEYDIALLKVEDVHVKSLSFGNSNNMDVTNAVLAAGYIYNFAGEATISKGIFSARRNMNSLSYLQSDISIDTGSSGGPLFDGTGAVIGINVYVTENRTFALSMSSESASMIIDVLLDTPTIEYVTESRPSNSINSILVEVGYTDNVNLELYNDLHKIKKSKKEHKKELEEELKKENVTTPVDGGHQKKYYCEYGYSLVGSKCIRQTSYPARNDIGKCKDGYIQNGNECTKNIIVDAVAEYNCEGTLTENKTCLMKHLWETGFASYSSRWGSCPKGKKCYDEGTDVHTNTMNKVFITDMVCPSKSIKIYSGTRIVWSNEEYIEDNFKMWNSRVPGAMQKHDADGLVYYEDVDNVLSLCAKDYDSKKNVYTTYTYEELQSVACPNGGVLTANNNNQGFYCKLNENPHWYSWDATCIDTAYTLMINLNGRLTCGKWVEEEHGVDPHYYCEEGNPTPDFKQCVVQKSYILPDNYVCDSGDILNGINCLKTEIIDPKSN